MTGWHDIDLGPHGRAGVNGRFKVVGETMFIYLEGSDHWYDWMIHFLPWNWRLERNAALNLLRELRDMRVTKYVIGGHSSGAAVAGGLAQLLGYLDEDVSFYGFGPKRPAEKIDQPRVVQHYRNERDIVPFLNFLRPRIKMVKLTYKGPIRYAHEPKSYYDVMKAEGFR